MRISPPPASHRFVRLCLRSPGRTRTAGRDVNTVAHLVDRRRCQTFVSQMSSSEENRVALSELAALRPCSRCFCNLTPRHLSGDCARATIGTCQSTPSTTSSPPSSSVTGSGTSGTALRSPVPTVRVGPSKNARRISLMRLPSSCRTGEKMLSAGFRPTQFRTLSASREEDNPLAAPPLSWLRTQARGSFTFTLGQSSYRRLGSSSSARRGSQPTCAKNLQVAVYPRDWIVL